MSALRILDERQKQGTDRYVNGAVRTGAHRREAVKITGSESYACGNVQDLFNRVVGDKTMDKIRKGDVGREGIFSVAEDFVLASLSCHGWHEEVSGIAGHLRKDTSKWVRALGDAIQHYADQVWAARHLP